MRFLVPTTLGLLVATAAVQAQAPVNDECSGAIPVFDGLNGPFSNLGATNSSPAFGCGLGGSDVWFVYTASCTGTMTAALCGSSYDTVVRIFDATVTPCGAFTTEMSCNDDSCGLQSSLSVPCVSSGVYYVSVGGFNGAQGTISLTMSCSPAAGADDECAGALPLTLGLNPGYSTLGYSPSAEPWVCVSGAAPDRWFTFTARCTAPHTFYMCSAGTNYDTALSIYSGTCGNLVQLDCNDDYCGLISGSTVSLSLGQTVYVRVGGYSNRSGAFDMIVDVGTNSGFVNTYADACGGLGLATSGSPNINGAITSTLSGVTGVSGLGYGFARAGANFCSTCVLGHDYSIAVIGSSFPLTIPCDPALIGASLFTQGFDLTAPGGCSALGISLSDTDEIVIG